jgi:two-component system chemotaxis response regulator CheB
VDVLYRSAAEVFGPRSLAVTLTGMGADGLEGARALKTLGAASLAQDQATSVVWGMPGAIAQAGLADRILPLDRLAEEIVRICQE